jgi:hypothetical protein
MLRLAIPSAFLRTGPQMMEFLPDSRRIPGAICAARASRMESACFVVPREGNAPPLAPPQHGGTRFPTLAARVRSNESLRGLPQVPWPACIPPI